MPVTQMNSETVIKVDGLSKPFAGVSGPVPQTSGNQLSVPSALNLATRQANFTFQTTPASKPMGRSTRNLPSTVQWRSIPSRLERTVPVVSWSAPHK